VMCKVACGGRITPLPRDWPELTRDDRKGAGDSVWGRNRIGRSGYRIPGVPGAADDFAEFRVADLAGVRGLCGPDQQAHRGPDLLSGPECIPGIAGFEPHCDLGHGQRSCRGRNTGVSMTGHLRFCFGAFFLFTSLSPSPASSNPFADLFNITPHAAPAPASAERECLSRHGKSTADGQHWVYRLDGHRKCWFQAAEGIATAKKRVYRHAAKQRALAENETARRKREAVVDARELLRSAPAETSQPTPPASELKVVDAASVLATGAAPVANRATDQLTPDRPSPRQVDVETVLSAAWAPSDAVAASVPPGSPAAFPIAEAGDDGRGRTASWLGMLLMALGLVSVLSSSRVLRAAVPLRQMK
jgi:hypothetical protein